MRLTDLKGWTVAAYLVAAVVLAVVLNLVFAPRASAAELQVGSSKDCVDLSAVAQIARGATIAGLTETEVRRVVYATFVESDPVALAYFDAIVTGAYRDKRAPYAYGIAFAESCMKNNGRLAPFFGVGV